MWWKNYTAAQMGQGLLYNRATCTPPFFSPNHMLSTTPPVLTCIYVEWSDVSGLCLSCSSTEWVINEMMIIILSHAPLHISTKAVRGGVAFVMAAGLKQVFKSWKSHKKKKKFIFLFHLENICWEKEPFYYSDILSALLFCSEACATLLTRHKYFMSYRNDQKCKNNSEQLINQF